MCGIVAVLRRTSTRPTPRAEEVLAPLKAARTAVAAADAGLGGADAGLTERLTTCASLLVEADRLLRGVPGLTALLADRELVTSIAEIVAAVDADLLRVERTVDRDAAGTSTAQLESVSAALGAAKDGAWSIARDRLRTAREVAALAGTLRSEPALRALLSIQEALSAIDRIEVRGRDSAGVHVLVRDHGLDLKAPSVAAAFEDRREDELFGHRAVRAVDGTLSFVYKAAAEIGELGDNVSEIRSAIQTDELLRLALASGDVEATVLAHTRWASVGIISTPNAHPLNSEETDRSDGPYVVAALNGDVDNYADLKADHDLRIRGEITTDTKVIPTLMSRHLAADRSLLEAFRGTVNTLEGSVAIGANAVADPGSVLLALRGSGQALYVGTGEDLFIVASEPYGVVEVADNYLRMDGETPADETSPTTSRGQIVQLRASLAGEREGIERQSYDGLGLPVRVEELAVPEITTRDVDRGSFKHYLLKEISEAPTSFRKTLRGKLVEQDGSLTVDLGEEIVSAEVRAGLINGSIRRIRVIGQGTAAIAGQGVAAAISASLGIVARANPQAGELTVDALPATELSAFELGDDMSATLVIAISQSGTTTDTNRTVDLVRARGAHVIAIVNRRGSDLTDKSDGVLYTADGRDVEMSVASTKAFYSQIAAGFLLAHAISNVMGGRVDDERAEMLAGLRDLPAAMEQVFELRPLIADIAREFAPRRRYWAMVGNGPNLIAAQELRIKLSELCYKSIACDVTEDKKHIDLSSEPLILVCAAGLSGSTADDVAKEVGIYRAHQAAPIVIANEGEERFGAAVAAISVPVVHRELAFVLSAMVGHLFGYEAALSIDATANPLREARSAIEEEISSGRGRSRGGEELLTALGSPMSRPVRDFFNLMRDGRYDGTLAASTAVRLASLLRYATGAIPLGSFQLDHGKVGTPGLVVDHLAGVLTEAIDELTRPVDAIKHQAKTVTVGISRSDESLLQVPLLQEVLRAGASRDRFSYDSLRTLAAIDPVVKEVTGFTRYRIEGDLAAGDARVSVVDRGGISLDLPLRTDRNPILRGTKHQVALGQKVLVTRGRSDGRLIAIVPEVRDNRTSGITLLHVRFHEELPLATLRSVLVGYRNRYAALRDSVMETEPTFREDLLLSVPLGDLVVEPISSLADRWRSS